MLNRVVLAGRLTRDPELRHTQTGTAVTNFALAVERDFKDQATGDRQSDFIDVIAWRSKAEFVSRYFTKGRKAIVEGRLQTRTWEDSEGNRHKAVEVVAENVYFGDSKRGEEPPSSPAFPAHPEELYSPHPNPIYASPQASFYDLDAEDDGPLPF